MHLGKQQKMIQVLEHLVEETRMEFQAPGFDMAHSQLLRLGNDLADGNILSTSPGKQNMLLYSLLLLYCARHCARHNR